MNSLDETLESVQKDEEKKIEDLGAKKYVDHIIKNKEIYGEIGEKNLDLLTKLIPYCENTQDKIISGTSLVFLLGAGYHLRYWKTKGEAENKDEFFKLLEEYFDVTLGLFI